MIPRFAFPPIVLAFAAAALSGCGHDKQRFVGSESSWSADTPFTGLPLPGSNDESAPDSIPSAASAQKMCRETCVANEPEPWSDEEPWCTTSTVDECVSTCLRVIDDLDRSCAECSLQSVSWPPANSSCSSWECVCSEGSPLFGWQIDCSAACVSTEERWRQERLAAPVPSPEGHLPTESVELGGLFPGPLVLDDGGALWTVGWLPGESAQRLVQFAEDGTPMAMSAESWESWPNDYRLLTNGREFLVVLEENGAQIAFFDAATQEVWRRPAGQLTPAQSPLVGVSMSWGGNADLRGADFAFVERDPERYGQDEGSEEFDWITSVFADGTTELSMAVPAAFAYELYTTYAMDSLGRLWAVAESDYGEPAEVKVFEASSSEVPALAFELAGNTGEADAFAMRADAEGGMYVLGWLRTSRSNHEFSETFVAHVSALATVDWPYAEHERIIHGATIEDFTWDDAGNVYLLTTEDPIRSNFPEEEQDALCSVYGCNNLAVRKIAADGTLAWIYEHRATSAGAGLALAPDGQLLVTGSARREEGTGLLLKFSAD